MAFIGHLSRMEEYYDEGGDLKAIPPVPDFAKAKIQREQVFVCDSEYREAWLTVRGYERGISFEFADHEGPEAIAYYKAELVEDLHWWLNHWLIAGLGMCAVMKRLVELDKKAGDSFIDHVLPSVSAEPDGGFPLFRHRGTESVVQDVPHLIAGTYPAFAELAHLARDKGEFVVPAHFFINILSTKQTTTFMLSVNDFFGLVDCVGGCYGIIQASIGS